MNQIAVLTGGPLDKKVITVCRENMVLHFPACRCWTAIYQRTGVAAFRYQATVHADLVTKGLGQEAKVAGRTTR